MRVRLRLGAPGKPGIPEGNPGMARIKKRLTERDGLSQAPGRRRRLLRLQQG